MRHFIRIITAKKFMRLDAAAVLILLVGTLISIHYNESDLDTVQNPWIALTAGDNTYIADMDRGRILVTAPNGRVLYQIKGQFSYIDGMTVDSDGNIYVINTSWKANSFMVERDTLFMFEPASGKTTELFRNDYDHATKHQMFGVKIISGDVNFVCAYDQSVTHFVLDKNGTELRKFTFMYDEAVTMLQDICVDSFGKKLYAIDKRGLIICFDETSSRIAPLCRWDNINGNEYVELYRMDISSDGVIYATEIVNNNLVAINDGKLRVIYSGGVGTFNLSVTEKEIGLITEGGFVILNAQGEVTRTAENIHWPFISKLQRIILIFLYMIIIITAVYGVLRLVCVLLLGEKTNAQLISRFIMLSVTIVCGFIIYQLLGSFYELLRNEKLSKLELVAHNISRMITEANLNGVAKPSDFMNESFRKLQNAMTSFIDYEYDGSMYGNIVRYDEKTGTVYDLAFLDNSIGAYYPLFGNEADEVIQIYETGEMIRSSTSTENGGFSYVKVPVSGRNGKVSGVVEVGTWTDVITNQVNLIIRNVLLQLAVWLVMILFIFHEIFEFMNLRELESRLTRSAGEMSLSMNRLLIFLVFLAYNLPTAFLPVYVANLYMKTNPAVNGLAMSAPISVNMALLGLIGLIGYMLVKRFSFSKSMAAGAVLTMIGDVIIAFAQSYAYLFIGLVLNGIGAGLQMNLVHSINSNLARKKNDSTIYALYQSGSLSGIMVGMTLGAILADILGHGNVFFVTAFLWLTIAAVVYVLARHVRLDTGAGENQHTGLMKFVFSRQVFVFLLCAVFFYVMISSFVYYYVPIYNDQLGHGSNMACLLIIIFSMCGIYFSGATTRLMMLKFGRSAIYISSVISLGALIFFAFFQSMPALITYIFMLGISASFGMAVRIAVFSEIPQTREYGIASTGVYDLVEMAGGAVGPIVFASMFAGDFLTGIMIFTGLSITALAVYFVIGRK